MDVVPFNKIECPNCGGVGTIEKPKNDFGVHEDAPAECRECGRQHPMRRVPLSDVFGGI